MENEKIISPVVLKSNQTTKSKESNSLIFLLSSLLILATLIAAFFAYKTQILVREIAESTQNKKVSESDQKTNSSWIEYLSVKDGFSIKLPSDFSKVEANEKFIKFTTDKTYFVITAGKQSEFKQWIEIIEENINDLKPNVKKEKIANKDTYFESSVASGGEFERNVFIVDKDAVIHLMLADMTETKNEDTPKMEALMDEIIKTFAFIQPVPEPEGI